MLLKTSHLKGFAIRATDGDLGHLDEFYFDDETWAIRYLTVQTGGWLEGREVLISPFSVKSVDAESKQVNVSLTKQQVEKSPNIDTHKPVSRQHEVEYLGYYGYPYYWSGPYLWGSSPYPSSLITSITLDAEETKNNIGKGSSDSHLRSNEAVKGYSINALDGEIGHVNGFVIDDVAWAIRYVEVATRNWLPGKKVLIPPSWIEKVSWLDSEVRVGVSRESIKKAPEYLESEPITHNYENAVYVHYGRPPYWIREAQHAGM